MKITKEYDSDEIYQFKLELYAQDFASAIFDIKNIFRKYLKYTELTDKEYDIVHKISNEVYEMIKDLPETQ